MFMVTFVHPTPPSPQKTLHLLAAWVQGVRSSLCPRAADCPEQISTQPRTIILSCTRFTLWNFRNFQADTSPPFSRKVSLTDFIIFSSRSTQSSMSFVERSCLQMRRNQRKKSSRVFSHGSGILYLRKAMKMIPLASRTNGRIKAQINAPENDVRQSEHDIWSWDFR